MTKRQTPVMPRISLLPPSFHKRMLEKIDRYKGKAIVEYNDHENAEKFARGTLIALGWTPPMSDEIPPEKSPIELESEIILNELTGQTNKSPEAIDRGLERGIIGEDPAPRLTGTPPNQKTEVAIPFSVKDALSEAISTGNLPLHPELVSWMEEEVAKYNGVPADTIAALHHIITEGKCWKYYPEIASIRTGFCYYPPEK